MKKNKKGVVSIYLTFIIVSIIIVLIAAVFAPMGVLFNTEMYLAGEDILLITNQSINDIQDPAVKAQVQSALDSAVSATTNNIEVNANIFQYGWVFMILLTGIIIFLLSRRIVEVGGSGLI